MTTSSSPKVAIVCDWLTGVGGAERVVLELQHLFPDAPVYTSQYDPVKLTWFKDIDVRTGWLQKLPLSLKKFLPVLRMIYFNNLDLRDYDIVISSSGAEAKGIKLRKDAVHICYMHAPTHYYWSRYEAYLTNPGFGRLDWLARIGLRALVGPLRTWDKRFAARPDHIITNSRHSQVAIKQYYQRESTVIYPPVELDRFASAASPAARKRSFVIAGRQTPYKMIDLAVAACTKLDEKLTVIGDGPDHQKLKDIAGDTIRFVVGASDQELALEVSQAGAFLFPGVDDFGIVAVEALAAGTPVIAFNAGGAKDYVIDGVNGKLFDDQTIDSLAAAITAFDITAYDAMTVAATAEQFSVNAFKQAILTYIKTITRTLE